LDWTKDSQFVVATSQAYELYWASANSHSTVNASATKDFEYQTFTCVLGWQVQGIFPGADGTEVNSLCRNKAGNYMVTGNDSQQVFLYKFPSTQPHSGHKAYNGHASHVTKVKFMMEDNLVISTGGNDKTNIIWSTDFGTGNIEGNAEFDNNNTEGQKEFSDVKNLRRKDKNEVDKYGNKIVKKNYDDEDDPSQRDPSQFREEIVEGGDEFVAVKPWKNAIKDPSDYAKPQRDYDQAPEIEVHLEYVHGFRAKDSRSNIFYNGEGKIVTHAAGVGITHDTIKNTQTHNQDHISDIMSIAMHPNKKIFATGEKGPKPLIIIWDSTNGSKTVKSVKQVVTKGVIAIGFSTDGKLLAATCMDDNHNVALFNYNESTHVCTPAGSAKGGTNTIIGLIWTSEKNFFTYGNMHVKYWNSTPSGPIGKECKAGA